MHLKPVADLQLIGTLVPSRKLKPHWLGLRLAWSAALGFACQSCLLPTVGNLDSAADAQSSNQIPSFEGDRSLPEDTSREGECVANESANTVCKCPRGHTGDRTRPDGCVDIEECGTENGGCDTSPLAKCINQTAAAPSCECPDGSFGHGVGADGCSTPPSLSTDTEVVPCGRYLCDEDTVKDPASGLRWQRVLPRLYEGCDGRYIGDRGTTGATCKWQDAANYCAGLSLDNNDYRLPTREELLSIVESTRTNPSIDTTAFPDTPAILFWSSSQQDTSGNVLGVHFNIGNSYGTQFTAAAAVRCVH